MSRDLARRIKIFNDAIAVEPRADRKSRKATEDAESWDDRTVRKEGVARFRCKHAHPALHRKAAARRPSATRVDCQARALDEQWHPRFHHLRRLHGNEITPVDG